jgi:intracellular septation protein
MHKGTLAFILVLGMLTVIFRNEKFIQWKPTIANWAFAAAFLYTHKYSAQPLVKSLFGKAVKLKDQDWIKLSLMWVVFFSVVGITNLFVAYNFSMTAWVQFKVFGLLGATLIFSVLQGIWLMKHGDMIEPDQEISEKVKTEGTTNNEIDRQANIESILRRNFTDAAIELTDESHLHAGHAGAKDGRGHFRLRIISDSFSGLNHLKRHQLVYQALAELMQSDIHALSIDAKTPDEVFD